MFLFLSTSGRQPAAETETSPQILATARDQRRKIIEDTDKHSDQSQDEGDDDVDTTLRKDRPSAEALERIKDYRMRNSTDHWCLRVL